MPAKKVAPKTLKVTQTKSIIGATATQRGTIRALGLKRINHCVEHVDTPVIRGMVFKVQHLVKVDEV